jgi:hypothetical protein
LLFITSTLAVTVTGSPAFTVAGLTDTLAMSCAWAVATQAEATSAAAIQELFFITNLSKDTAQK